MHERPKPLFFRSRPANCPGCGSRDVVLILYGYPDAIAMRQFLAGEIDLGGCMVGGVEPVWRCHGCGLELFHERDRALVEAAFEASSSTRH